jgi:hypothetical protein
LIENSFSIEIDVYNQLQSDFNRVKWLTHFNKIRQLYVDVDAFKKDFEIMIYHLKNDIKFKKNSSSKREMKSIFFLNKTLSFVKSRYWSTELEMTKLVWEIKKIAHMIKFSQHSTIIYIDYDANSVITTTIKLNIISRNKLNMKLMRVFMYLSQFRLNIRHRSKKFNVISNALSRLSIKKDNSLHEALNLNQDHFQSNIQNSENDLTYVYLTILMKMSSNFRSKIQKKYRRESRWTKLIKMLKSLKKRREKNSHEKFEIDFLWKDELFFHKDRKRLCIFANCETNVFKLAHDQNNHFEHNKIYIKLIDRVYISKLSRNIRQYIKHCSTCELNQIKRHLTYEELVSISKNISFQTLAMNFISTLSNNMNTALIVTCKAFKKITIILEKFTWTVFNWAETLFDRLIIANWNISKRIISDRNLKFISKFWTIIFRKLNTKLLMFTTYYSQTNEHFERMNQTVKIAFRFFLIENSKTEWIDAALLIQANLNNSSNVAIELFSNKFMYDFRIKNTLSILTEKSISENFTTSSLISEMLKDTRLRNRQETANVVFFVNVKVKIIHDKRHKSFFLDSKKKTFLRLHKKYNLSEIINRKLSQQKCDSFRIIRRVKRLTYELELSKTWRIHSVIFVTQFEFTSDDSYKSFRSNHSDFVFVKRDTETYKFYEIERVLNKKTRQYERIKMNQYLIRWKKYESEFDEWKSLANLQHCINLIEKFERRKSTRSQKKTRSRKQRVNSLHQQ